MGSSFFMDFLSGFFSLFHRIYAVVLDRVWIAPRFVLKR
jgi:hypothetical protein